MPETQGLRVAIVCDGEELTEYNIEKARRGKLVTCWIASEAGKEFTIRTTNRNTDESFSFDFVLDGDKLSWGQFMEAREPDEDAQFGDTAGIPGSDGKIRPFKFCMIDTTDDYQQVSTNVDMDNLGLIEICVRRARVDEEDAGLELKVKQASDADDDSEWDECTPIIHEQAGDRRLSLRLRKVEDSGSGSKSGSDADTDSGEIESWLVHEQSKRAGWHRISLGEEREEQQLAEIPVHFLDSTQHPFAKFRFFYRPRDRLIADRIIPLPSPQGTHMLSPSESGTLHMSGSSASRPPSDHIGQGRARKRQRIDNAEGVAGMSHSHEIPSGDPGTKATVKVEPSIGLDRLLKLQEQVHVAQEQLDAKKRELETEWRKTTRHGGSNQVKQEESAAGRIFYSQTAIDLAQQRTSRHVKREASTADKSLDERVVIDLTED
ncbi:hypothetical protein OBBRIDRAFT_884708 [Obba rivulosa]|uniref:DUF7918 domain-containing protein n=1 Tax=Obba rivulosa TaxID=1052685 RepID=A0A8E2DRQ9_9APHY|nr:hypothetical protein OBBRIDRAFT_884708 [Obba rivulosa]